MRVMTALNFRIIDGELYTLPNGLEDAAPQVILKWALDEFGSDVALATGFGAEGCILVDMVARINPSARIFYLDTDLLFPETYELRDRLEERYGIRFERRSAARSLEQQNLRHGDKLWERDPDLCCRLRKVEPLKQMLSGLRAWITAIRRDQSPARAHAKVVDQDAKFGLIKINPLAGWTKQQVWKYALDNDVPYNPLYDQGYSSIGCMPCTTPVQINEDQRAGRWRGFQKTECGLHQ
ncbi:MAG TPA: phosphoadenylyl-sulfate reductase [Pyrinomonadaceae bacterium]|nr:phosphoadenylyl-sulfate reductase [Pyrinomonadaceae bacterium]